MSQKAHGQIRRSQVITTYGPGALIDLPNDSAIVAGLETWPKISDLDEIQEPRLTAKLQAMTGVTGPRLYEPPPDKDDYREKIKGIGAFEFPEWFLVQETTLTEQRERSRRLVHRRGLDGKGRFDGRPVVAVRFVRACVRGHVDDLDWYGFAHGQESTCRRQLWLDETGIGGDLFELVVRCECGRSRRLYEAVYNPKDTLGGCSGARPWLGQYANESCNQTSRLLTRTASNAYFPQVVSVLSLPDRGTELQRVVGELWPQLHIVTSLEVLQALSGSTPMSPIAWPGTTTTRSLPPFWSASAARPRTGP